MFLKAIYKKSINFIHSNFYESLFQLFYFHWMTWHDFTIFRVTSHRHNFIIITFFILSFMVLFHDHFLCKWVSSDGVKSTEIIKILWIHLITFMSRIHNYHDGDWKNRNTFYFLELFKNRFIVKWRSRQCGVCSVIITFFVRATAS